MLIIHEPSDDALLAAWEYFRGWRRTRNYLLLFDALHAINMAEQCWRADYDRRRPLRREWQVLRRCVSRGIARLRTPLLNARTPSETQRAIYGGGKRATLARLDYRNDQAIKLALTSGTIDEARALLATWGIHRAHGYLKKRASQLGLTCRTPAKRSIKASDASRVSLVAGPFRTSRREPRITEIAPGRIRHKGRAY